MHNIFRRNWKFACTLFTFQIYILFWLMIIFLTASDTSSLPLSKRSRNEGDMWVSHEITANSLTVNLISQPVESSFSNATDFNCLTGASNCHSNFPGFIPLPHFLYCYSLIMCCSVSNKYLYIDQSRFTSHFLLVERAWIYTAVGQLT